MCAGFAATALSVSTLMLACGKKEEAKESGNEASKAETSKPEPLKVGFIYVG
ncbi:MAG: BMP family ABC transporter substrate-binding protein, partial [Betaproteobacteria bacterium]|nr:BMP family ABC transporter substrate-binding protein [Betaproteobacteria bacterium]